VGLVFVAETISVMLQVSYFKLTGGKRIFKMTPLHHHFEMIGWSETQITLRFWLVGMMAGLLGVALALL
jgi:phospho-N-acetylmuramoyl-pentapeptide-transferase